ncbi:MAG: haloacid dehalogenase-like hydrolase [Armatimonadota bacterium]
MILGVDFDNTIVCYDEVFHAAALERELIPAHLPVSKDSVRDYLRRCDQEEAWTELQGYVYGPRMRDAQPFPGVLEFLGDCAKAGLPLWIVSHKTRHPYRGPQYDLHESARQWLADHGVHEAGLARDHVFFELTKLDKLQRLGQIGCTHFIDDLPEFLAEPTFPAGVERLLFDPNDHHPREQRFPRLRAWSEAGELLGL